MIIFVFCSVVCGIMKERKMESLDFKLFHSWLWSWPMGQLDLLFCHLWWWHQTENKVQFSISLSILYSPMLTKKRTMPIQDIDSIFNHLFNSMAYMTIVLFKDQRLRTPWMMAQNVLLQETWSPWLNKPLAMKMTVLLMVRSIETKITRHFPLQCSEYWYRWTKNFNWAHLRNG